MGLLCITLVLCFFLQGCKGNKPDAESEEGTESGQITDMKQETEEQLEEEVSAFEITSHQRELAADNEEEYKVLDAGRGNPNWINTQSRYAFSRFMEFATGECERTMNEGNMAGQAVKKGIGKRFDLARKKGVVLMYGPGFGAPEGTVRVSLANLNKEDYEELGNRLFELLDEYYEEFSQEEALPDAA